MSDRPWNVLAPATCLTTGKCICEPALQDQWIRQPQASASTLLLMGVGLALAYRYREWNRSIALMAAAVGSLFFHTSFSFLGEVADFATICGLACGWWGSRPSEHLKYWGLGTGVSGLVFYFFPALRLLVTAALSGVAVFLIYKKTQRESVRTVMLALALIGVGATFFALDLTHRSCEPVPGIYGHTLWHVFAALGLGVLYRELCVRFR